MKTVLFKNENQLIFLHDFDYCTELFMQFAVSRCNDDQIARIRALSREQLEQWQESAVDAYNLDYNKNFKIKPNTLISTPQGFKLSSETSVVFGNAAQPNSKFSFGTQQCLQARCNKDRKKIDSGIIDDSMSAEYIKALKQCFYPFYISGEKQIICSSTGKNFIDLYKESFLISLSGTSGAKNERKEQELINDNNFSDVPRHNKLKRKCTRFHKVSLIEEKNKKIIKLANKSIEKDQPILVMCEDDSKVLHALNCSRKKFDKSSYSM